MNIAWISLFLYLFCLVMLFALRWARRTYPMDDAPLVYFVLTSETGGVDSNTWHSVLCNVLLPAGATAVFSFVVIALANLLSYGNLPYPMLDIKVEVALVLYTAIIMALKLKAWRYLAIWRAVHKKAVDSKFYDDNYADPNKVHIDFPSKKRNLIVIFMESMESTFADMKLLPRLVQIAQGQDAISFGREKHCEIGGGENLDGTSWTVAAIIAKLSGLPYFRPFSGHGESREALAKAVTLGDILSYNGYECVFAMGSEKRFEGRDAFLEKHGFAVHDIDWYKAHGMIDKDYKVFWGFEDAKLYDMAKKETDKAGHGDKPFCYAMLTVDTHFPDGYRCPLCPTSGGRQIEDVIRCADNLVSSFVEWCKTQSWYDNTTIVIMGDHNYLGAPCNDFVRDATRKTGLRRKWLDIIINSAVSCDNKERDFSAYDMYPTILEAAGCKIEHGALAFGRSLFQERKTLVEEVEQAELNAALMHRTVQYEALKR